MEYLPARLISQAASVEQERIFVMPARLRRNWMFLILMKAAFFPLALSLT